jgi:ATP synthase protein I
MSTSPEKLERLSKKIILAKGKEETIQERSIKQNNMNYVWRMVLELVVGMLFGFGIGFSLDRWFGTAPLMIVIMSLFGFAAGIRTMMLTANEFAALESKKRSKE